MRNPDAVNTTALAPLDIVEWCARELEWMARGHVAHEHIVLVRAAKRLRDEGDKIVLRAGGVKA